LFAVRRICKIVTLRINDWQALHGRFVCRAKLGIENDWLLKEKSKITVIKKNKVKFLLTMSTSKQKACLPKNIILT